MPASCRRAMSGPAQARYAMRRGTFRGSHPRPPQLAVTTRRRPMSWGVRCRCSRGSCGRRSTYEAYSSGGPGSGGGGSQREPCSRPTGSAPKGDIIERHNGPRRHFHGDRSGRVKAGAEQGRPRAPRGGGGRGLAHPGRSKPPAAGALQTHGVRGLLGAPGFGTGAQAAVVPGVIVPPL